MRSIFLISFLLLCAVSLGQNNLSGTRRTSPYTYIYQLTNKEAYTLYKSKMNKAGEAFLHTLIDSFYTDSPLHPSLSNGHYLLLHTEGNKLRYQLQTDGDVKYTLLNNDHDLLFILHTREGKCISNARVTINNRSIVFDARSQSYRLNKYKKSGIIKAEYEGVVYYFPIVTKKSTRYYFKNLITKFKNNIPVKHLVTLFKEKSHYRYPDYFHDNTSYEKSFRGFMVFNKPIYKPGDTVRLKAFISTKSGKAVSKNLLLRLTGRGLDPDTLMTIVKPYNKGGYTYEFVLSDSLDLDLDDEYMITLEELRSKKFNIDEYYGNLDDEGYALKRKVLMRGKFKYEEYELQSSSFTTHADKKEHSRGELLSLYLKATDENEMAVMDGRVEILIKPSVFPIPAFNAQKVFLPDTLWHHIQPLDAIGETKIVIPDSIFPKASFKYEILCTYLNSNNEFKTEILYEEFREELEKIVFRQDNDSLRIAYFIKGEEAFGNATLIALSGKDTLQEQFISLPASIAIHPFITEYQVRKENASSSYVVKASKNIISCAALRTKDSIQVQSMNPYKIPFWYTIFAGNRPVAHGYTNDLKYKDKVMTRKNYFVAFQYVYGSKAYRDEYTVAYQDKLLNIQVQQPEFIYPGQTTAIDILVTDVSGKPVENADVTAYSFTSKFEKASTPFIPYFGKIYPYRKQFYEFHPASEKELEAATKLNWQRWSKEIKLDTIEYYRFLHPQTIYLNTEAARDSITQIAPFVVKDRDIQPVHQIYIDERPVFFSQADQLQRYSFKVSEGKHSIRLRTLNMMITLNDLWIAKGLKTFISINADTSNKRIQLQKMPDTLTAYEKNLWTKYMILVENNFGESFASIRGIENIYLLNANKQPNYLYQPSFLAGPFFNQYQQLNVTNKFSQFFEAEGGYSYHIQQGLIKQKQLGNSILFKKYLPATEPQYNFRDLALTEKEIDSLWQEHLDHRNATQDLFINPNLNSFGNGILQIGVGKLEGDTGAYVKNILLFRNDDPDYMRVYKGSSRNLGYLRPGIYRLFFLLNGNNYFIKDSIHILPNGINYYGTGVVTPKQKDSVSIRISEIINNREIGNRYIPGDMDRIKETFNDRYLDASSFTKYFSGQVRDENGNPVPGAMVQIKGTTRTTVTNPQGYFEIAGPSQAALVISSVGFNSQEMRVNENNYYSVALTASEMNLSEVVVIGYGLQRKNMVTGAVSVVQGLEGKAAGIIIRGASTAPNTTPPLVIVDGLPYSGSLEDIDPSLIASTRILKYETAKAIYGSRAISGVILIATKKNAEGALSEISLQQGNSLRRNFRDDAYWQPAFRTNSAGKVSFKARFPDDITNWRTFVIAIGSKKQTGFAENSIKSFKTLTGTLPLPQFAIEGDSVAVIAKALNYTSDSIQVKRTFYIGDKVVDQKSFGLHNAHIDTFSVTIPAEDSIKLKYTVERNNGYFDGEERSIPIYEQGVLETKGFFAALNKDTTFTLKIDSGITKVYAEASLLPVLLDEVERIRNYEYLCNEQLASKLKAVLVKKKIYQYLKKEFKEEKNIKELITKLNQSKSKESLWGWWANNDPSSWISLHVTEALLLAERNGYVANLNKQLLTDFLVYHLESYTGTEKLAALQLLHKLEAKVDYKKYVDTLEKKIQSISLYEHLKVLEIKQGIGLAVSLDSVLLKLSRTMFGSIYLGDDNYRFFDNAVQNTILLYRLLKTKGGYEKELGLIRNYFLEKRKDGQWKNTYESALILETILPDLLTNDSLPAPVSLIINGKDIITQFPYAKEMVNAGELTITKTGDLPVYFTSFQQYWNKQPGKVSGDFNVTSFFEKNGQTIKSLKAGEPVLFKINVVVKADADYVMIEAPIPAGCSYKDKSRSYQNNEVHREHFKNKVNIFCSGLKKGNYTYTISLLPRYTGQYHVNPAKAEMMYFPVFYGMEEMKKVNIK